MVNRPPSDRDPPPPGGFNPRFGSGRGKGGSQPPSFGGRPINRYDYVGPGPDPRERRDPRDGRDPPRDNRDPRDTRDPREGRDPRTGRDPHQSASDLFAGLRGAPPTPPPPPRQGMARSTKILLALGALLLLAAIAFGLSLGRSGPGDDALGEEKEAGREAAADPEARCAAPATYDKVKRELFRQAAAQRGADVTVFDRLAGYAALRVTSPVLREQDEELQRVSCQADVSLDLPPGVQVVGGRRSLSAYLGYNLQPAADRSGDVVTLTGAEPITAPLATIARIGETPAPDDQPTEEAGTDSLGQPLGNSPPVAPSPPAESRPAPAPEREPPPPPRAAPQPPRAAPPPPRPAPPRSRPAPQPSKPAPRPPAAPKETAPRTSSARPSFNCANASNRAERAICGNSGLASLDRQMSSRFFAARRGANTTQRVLLERTRGRFLAYRNRCSDEACIADAYRDRIREINDIMADRWVSPE